MTKTLAEGKGVAARHRLKRQETNLRRDHAGLADDVSPSGGATGQPAIISLNPSTISDTSSSEAKVILFLMRLTDRVRI